MAVTINPFSVITNFLNKHQDTRTADWFLMSNPFYTLAICLSYVYVVKVLGPKFMENRKPFQLQKVLVIYNFLQVLFSLWLFYQIGMGGWFTGEYSLTCQPVDYSNKPSTLRMVHSSWWYYFSKYTEFLDTIFFVLRKKYDHISTLHVIHHGIMPMSVWFGVKFTPGGHSTFFGLLNSFVHIIMYFYYMVSALGPGMQKYLWWKKYLTTLQMCQFVAIMVHAFQLLFIDCNYPRAFVWWIGMHAVMFFFLFKDFYNQAYSRRTRARANGAAAAVQNGSAKENGDLKQNGSVKENGAEKIKENGLASKQNGFVQNGYTVVHENYINGGAASSSTNDLHHRLVSH